MMSDQNNYSAWHKSTFSDGSGGCVEVRHDETGGAQVRDSKLGNDSPVLTFNAHEWDSFVKGVQKGEF